MAEHKLILSDMDNVLADFDGGLDTIWRIANPKRPELPREHFYFKNDYPSEFHQEIKSIYQAEGFLRGLSPVPGGVEALKEIASRGHRVEICTSPLSSNPYNDEEKLAWVEFNFGPDWLNKMKISPDKTVVEGDILIDDKPEITGDKTPSWEHVVYSRPYNEHVKNKRRLTWENWREILTELV